MSIAVPRVTFRASYTKRDKIIVGNCSTLEEVAEFFKPVNLETDFTCMEKIYDNDRCEGSGSDSDS